MRKSSNKQIINLISIIWVVASFSLLLLFWDSLSSTKITMLILFMALFLYMLILNTPRNVKKSSKLDGNDSYRVQQRQGSDKVKKLTQFFNQLGQSSQRNFNQTEKKSKWQIGLRYSSDRQYRSESSVQYYGGYRDINRQQQSGQLDLKNQLNIFIPQNLTTTLQKIREKISPNKYMKVFQNQIQILRGNQHPKQNTLQFYTSKTSLQSLCYDKTTKYITLTSDYDLIIKDQIYCAQIICENLQDKVKTILKQINLHFKHVSDTVIKCFNMKVNFYINSKDNDYNSKEISIYELKDFLIKFRRDSFIPQKFKPIIPIKDFMRIHLDRLNFATNQVVKFLQFIENQELMTFNIYINILRQTFTRQSIQICKNYSAFSQVMKKVKHGFYVHQVGANVSFTYNRIKNFVTQNPLIVVIAFFAQNYKQGLYDKDEFVRDVNRFFKQKTLVIESNQR